MPTDLLSAPEAAARLGVTRQRLHALITAGRLPAERVGRAWVLRLADVEAHQRLGPGGRAEPEPAFVGAVELE